MKGYVYILKDRDGRYYVGSTSHVPRRLAQHEHGHTQTTHRMNQPMLVLVQEYENLTKARKVERKIKKLKRKDYIEKMVLGRYIKTLP